MHCSCAHGYWVFERWGCKQTAQGQNIETNRLFFKSDEIYLPRIFSCFGQMICFFFLISCFGNENVHLIQSHYCNLVRTLYVCFQKKKKIEEKPRRISIREKLKEKQAEVNRNSANKQPNIVHGKNSIDL